MRPSCRTVRRKSAPGLEKPRGKNCGVSGCITEAAGFSEDTGWKGCGYPTDASLHPGHQRRRLVSPRHSGKPKPPGPASGFRFAGEGAALQPPSSCVFHGAVQPRFSGGRPLEPAFTTDERCLSGLFPAMPRRFPLQSVRIAAKDLLV